MLLFKGLVECENLFIGIFRWGITNVFDDYLSRTMFQPVEKVKSSGEIKANTYAFLNC